MYHVFAAFWELLTPRRQRKPVPYLLRNVLELCVRVHCRDPDADQDTDSDLEVHKVATVST